MEQITVSRHLVAAVLSRSLFSDNDSAVSAAAVELEEALAEAPAGPVLHVKCFGGFRVSDHCGERFQPPPPKRGRDLIQYLVLHPARSASRERLSELFWPDLDGAGINHRLHIAASGARAFLRKIFADVDPIRCAPDGYTWHPSVRVSCDALRFTELYRVGTLESFKRAVSLYAGELFEGEETDWLQRERLRYTTMYGTMLERLAQAALAANDAEAALGYGLDLLALDRAHEGASRMVMQCFGALGRRARALAEYEALKAHLQRHLGVEPMPETQSAICAIMGWTTPR